ncbi:MAG: relaxase/mobilization nuclease domain-containing protein [Tissierella sp.]|uniref:relaxase/mobilization nuclease domain-containing protein n=1 Tax=Tissierella sp. TaxID=41274 RepID=UPI003F9E258F
MAIIKAVNSKSSIGTAINYVSKKEKTEEKLISGIDCNPITAIDEMKATKELYDKKDGRQYSHFIQSFNPKDTLSPEKAHKIGKEFIRNNDKFKGHEILLTTHKDKKHIHNHFIINSVNYETGRKFHTTKYEYQAMKDKSNELSKDHGLTVPEKTKEKGKITSFNQNKYRVMERHFKGTARSYVIDTALAVKKAQGKSTSREDFIKEMKDQGYSTNWTDTRKHVTFINNETGKRVRLANLEKTFNDSNFTKGGLTDEFEQTLGRRERSRGTKSIDSRNKGVKRAYEELHQGTDGQGLNQPPSSLKRDSGDRRGKQKGTRANDFDIGRAKEHIRKSASENARSLGELSKPDARTRKIEQEKARELERANRRELERRIERNKSRNRENTR